MLICLGSLPPSQTFVKNFK
uniref:Uncharacterized protein n=1 Tax=Anguilla anguilla TaxID=7936 RepID=A0A0E9UDW8_ANGAN